MPEPHCKRAKQEVTFSVLTEMGTWCRGQVRSSPSLPLPPQKWLPGWSLLGDHCALLRTLLQQLQKLQTLVTSKISRPYKMAATQTGTCLMVRALSPAQHQRKTALP
jgi:hypothetical protein